MHTDSTKSEPKKTIEKYFSDKFTVTKIIDPDNKTVNIEIKTAKCLGDVDLINRRYAND